LGEVLKSIHIPDDGLAQIEKKLTEDHCEGELSKEDQRQKLEQRLIAIRKRMDQAYTDKLDGKISLRTFGSARPLSGSLRNSR